MMRRLKPPIKVPSLNDTQYEESKPFHTHKNSSKKIITFEPKRHSPKYDVQKEQSSRNHGTNAQSPNSLDLGTNFMKDFMHIKRYDQKATRPEATKEKPVKRDKNIGTNTTLSNDIQNVIT